MEPINFRQIQELLYQEIERDYANEFTPEEIRKLAGQMIFYVTNGSPYGEDIEGFLKWYIEKGGKLHERD